MEVKIYKGAIRSLVMYKQIRRINEPYKQSRRGIEKTEKNMVRRIHGLMKQEKNSDV